MQTLALRKVPGHTTDVTFPIIVYSRLPTCQACTGGCSDIACPAHLSPCFPTSRFLVTAAPCSTSSLPNQVPARIQALVSFTILRILWDDPHRMPEVIIIGGGFSGLCMAIQLKRQLGLEDFLLLWADHTYAGVKCDTPTALYSFSFGQRYWKDLYNDGATIQSYLQSMAYRYQILQSNTVFRSDIVAATWNEHSKCWTVIVMDKSEEGFGRITEYTCKILISAVGNMSVPNELNLPGKDIFQGTIVHSGPYGHSVDVKSKNVVIIGNDRSAHQIVGAIAPHVKSLTIFGPANYWILPRPTLPASWFFNCFSRYFASGRSALRFALFAVAERRQKAMHWENGRSVRKSIEQESRDYLNRVAPVQYRDQLIPSFAYGAERTTCDMDYLKTLHRPNVQLYPEYPQALDGTNVITQDGQNVPADVIIAATGFNAQDFLHPMTITGQQGRDLQTHVTRDGGITNYKGSFYSHFPNFAAIGGSNSGSAHNSEVFMIECQVNMVLKRMIAPVLIDEDVNSVVVKPEKEANWMAWLGKEMRDTVREHCNKRCYTDKKSFCTTIYPRSHMHFWWQTYMTPSTDFNHDANDMTKVYLPKREFQGFPFFICVYLLVAILSFAI